MHSSSIAFGAASMLIGSLIACGSNPTPDEGSRGELSSVSTTPCEATHGGANLAIECHRDAPGASGTACVYAQSKPQ